MIKDIWWTTIRANNRKTYKMKYNGSLWLQILTYVFEKKKFIKWLSQSTNCQNSSYTHYHKKKLSDLLMQL